MGSFFFLLVIVRVCAWKLLPWFTVYVKCVCVCFFFNLSKGCEWMLCNAYMYLYCSKLDVKMKRERKKKMWEFTEPYHRLCAFPIVIPYFHALPLGAFLRWLRHQLRWLVYNVLPFWNSNDALQSVMVAVEPFVNRLFELVAFDEHSLLLCHRTTTNDVHSLARDAVATYRLPFDSGMHLVRDSVSKGENEKKKRKSANNFHKNLMAINWLWTF